MRSLEAKTATIRNMTNQEVGELALEAEALLKKLEQERDRAIRERDEARRERDEALKVLEGWELHGDAR